MTNTSPPRPGLRSSSGGAGAINLTPLLDVLFLILFFFLLATEAKREIPAVEVQLPAISDIQRSRAVLPESVVLITITAEDEIWLNLDKVPLEELGDRLAALDRSVARDVRIRADQDSRSRPLVEVIVACQRAGFESSLVETRRPPASSAP